VAPCVEEDQGSLLLLSGGALYPEFFQSRQRKGGRRLQPAPSRIYFSVVQSSGAVFIFLRRFSSGGYNIQHILQYMRTCVRTGTPEAAVRKIAGCRASVDMEMGAYGNGEALRGRPGEWEKKKKKSVTKKTASCKAPSTPPLPRSQENYAAGGAAATSTAGSGWRRRRLQRGCRVHLGSRAGCSQ
jgi:hypothetical protein